MKDIKDSYERENLASEEKAINAIKTNSKAFFKYANQKRKVRSRIGPLMTNSGELTENAREMADILSHQYESVFSITQEEQKIKNGSDFFMDTGSR